MIVAAEYKLSYTASEIDEKLGQIDELSSKMNDVALKEDIPTTAAEVNALPANTPIPSVEGLASEDYVDQKVAELVDSSPEALNTLNELAQALGEDPNFATTITNELAKKVNKDDLPNIINGDGENAIVINEGDANGKSSIAGGTTDKSLVTDIVGSAAGLLMPTPTIPIANGNASLSYGAGTVAHSAGSMAIGANSSAGCLGYYFWDIDFANKIITLSTNQKSLLSSRDTPTKLEWATDDVICIINNDRYVNCATITAVDTTNYTITVDSLPFTEIDDPTTKTPDDRSVYVASKPASGEVELGFFAYSRGYESKAVGMMSNAIGYENIAADTAAFVTGRENIGAHASLVGGLRNEATGKETLATGRDNTASGDQAAVVGKENTASGKMAFASGYLNEASGNTSHVEGVSNVASGKAAHAEGTSNIASGENAHADGNKTVASGMNAQSHGAGTVAQRRNQTVIGRYNEIDTQGDDGTKAGKYAFIIGKGTGEDVFDEEGNITTKKRSNAATVDWSGNAWFNGTLSAEKGLNSYITAGQKEGETLGTYATAEGRNVIAQGYCSHVEGYGTLASCVESEYLMINAWDGSAKNKFYFNPEDGFNPSTSGKLLNRYAAINGIPYKIISEDWSNVDDEVGGNVLITLETAPESQPLEIAIYESANIDNGNYAHVEGYYTIANQVAQHVQGIYNLANTRYAHIVGNGTDEENRSNAHTLDWNGNAWFAGDVYVSSNSGTDRDDGSLKLATEQYVDSEIAKIDLPETDLTGYATEAYVNNSYTTAGQREGVTLGTNATAEGTDVSAVGNESHAEGGKTRAKGNKSHAEGYQGTAYGAASHVEGWSSNEAPTTMLEDGVTVNITAAGLMAAWDTSKNFSAATGKDSHVEGVDCIAAGDESHAEGYKTKASGGRSHTEGVGTIAAKQSQHVQGRYNIEDTEVDATNSNLGKYAHIVGNGTNAVNRSNAHTLDWSGNAWFAGDVVAGDVSLQELNTTIGDISTALDSIIAIQEELMGIIKFTIDGVEYTATEGMTWFEWCDSEYNTIGMFVDGSVMYVEGGLTLAEDESQLTDTDTIVAGAEYMLM